LEETLIQINKVFVYFNLVEFPYSSISQDPKKVMYKQFNNFEQPQMVMSQAMPQMMQPVDNTPTNESEEEEIGEFVYTFVERLYPK
jgi:hypothetical protein